MCTEKPKLTSDKQKEVFDTIFYSSRLITDYQSVFAEYELSIEQIDELIRLANDTISSALESKIAKEVTAYLNGKKEELKSKMSASKPQLTEADMPKINNKILYSSRDVSVYRAIFDEYNLTNEQIDELLIDVGVGVTSAVEAKTAESVTAFLKSMKQ